MCSSFSSLSLSLSALFSLNPLYSLSSHLSLPSLSYLIHNNKQRNKQYTPPSQELYSLTVKPLNIMPFKSKETYNDYMKKYMKSYRKRKGKN